tara:strand:+ start:110538 stop:111176 length:639 start_codon:yes stop_codon:yes gene_type:complete
MERGFFKKCMFPALLLLSFYGCSKKSISEAIRAVEKMSLVKEYKNSSSFMGEGYCYYVFQGVLDPVQIPPKTFSKFIKGGTLSLKHLESYNEWLKGEKGQLCQSVVGDKFNPISPEGDKQYVIFMNLEAIENEGKDPKVTLNHEKLHVAFSLFNERRDRIKEAWHALTKEQKERFKESHPGYNFSNDNVVLREFFAYKFQDSLKEGMKFLVE